MTIQQSEFAHWS